MDIQKLIGEITPEKVKEIKEESMKNLNIQKQTPISNLAKYIDHTILQSNTKKETIKLFCQQAEQYEFASVCCNPTHVKYVASLLKGKHINVCAVIGFPLGANTSLIKGLETKDAVENGAQEVDMVINIGAVKDENYELVADDIKAVIDATSGHARVKVIIETCLLTDEEKIKVCMIAKALGANFVKTSSGFSSGGATAEDVALMKLVVGPEIGVKASTGVRTLELATKMIHAGASRIGTGSAINYCEIKK
jgi:deoxyribose-phosphate aldolase